MISSVVKTSGLILVLTLSVAAQQRAAAQRREPAPGFVSVIHAVETAKLVEQLRTQQNSRVGVPGSAPQVIFHVTTGLAIDESGHVITRLAYVDPKDKNQQLSIITPAGDIFVARLVGVDFPTGFAVLAVESLKITLPKFAGAAALANGTVVQIQSADYVPQRVASEKQQAIRISPSVKFSQGNISDDSIYSKARGALTLRSVGLLARNDSSIVSTFDNEVIGMVQYAGYGRAFLFPVSVIRDTIARRVLEKNDNVPAGWLGLTGESVARIQDTEFSALGLENKAGVIVREVSPNSPASTAGVLSSDVITGIDNLSVTGEADLRAKLLSMPAGQKVHFSLFRNRQATEIEVVLGARPYDGPVLIFEELARVWSTTQSSSRDAIDQRIKELESQINEYNFRKDLSPRARDEAVRELTIEILHLRARQAELNAANTSVATSLGDTGLSIGITTRDISAQLADTFGTKSGVLVDSVEKGSIAEKAGIKVGDIIINVGGRTIRTASQLKAVLASKRGVTPLKVVREKQEIVIEVNSK
jgi:S1-C subfamily serine protease